MSRILTRFPSLHGKELSLKYADTLNDWIELSADDLDSFVDMIETAKDSARGNLITIELKVCELAQTLQQTEQKRLPSWPSPNYERMSGSVHVAKNQPARRLDEEFTCSLNESTEDVEYESSMKECYMQCGVWNQMKIWSSHLLDNLSNCLINLKNSGDSTGFEPMTSAMPVQCSHQLSYEVTQWRAGQFVGLMFSRERNVIWKNVICSAVFEIKWRYDPRTCWTI